MGLRVKDVLLLRYIRIYKKGCYEEVHRYSCSNTQSGNVNLPSFYIQPRKKCRKLPENIIFCNKKVELRIYFQSTLSGIIYRALRFFACSQSLFYAKKRGLFFINIMPIKGLVVIYENLLYTIYVHRKIAMLKYIQGFHYWVFQYFS